MLCFWEMTDASAKARIINNGQNETESDLLWLADEASPDEVENVDIIDLKGDMWFVHSGALGFSASGKQDERGFPMTRM